MSLESRLKELMDMRKELLSTKPKKDESPFGRDLLSIIEEEIFKTKEYLKNLDKEDDKL